MWGMAGSGVAGGARGTANGERRAGRVAPGGARLAGRLAACLARSARGCGAGAPAARKPRKCAAFKERCRICQNGAIGQIEQEFGTLGETNALLVRL